MPGKVGELGSRGAGLGPRKWSKSTQHVRECNRYRELRGAGWVQGQRVRGGCAACAVRSRRALSVAQRTSGKSVWLACVRPMISSPRTRPAGRASCYAEQVNSALRGAKLRYRPSRVASRSPNCTSYFPTSCVCVYVCVSMLRTCAPRPLPPFAARPLPPLARPAATSALLSSAFAYLSAHAEFSAKGFDDDGRRQMVPSPYRFGQLSTATATAASVFTFRQRDEGQRAGGRSHGVLLCNALARLRSATHALMLSLSPFLRSAGCLTYQL